MIYQVDSTGELFSKKVSGVFCNGLRWPGLYHSGGPVLISLFGPTNSVRTVWARLREGITAKINDEHIKLDNKKNRFIKIQTPLEKEGFCHIVLVEERATFQYTQGETIFQIGEDAPESFFGRLDRICTVPFRKTWKDYLWQKGLEREAIEECPGFGIPTYSIQCQNTVWSDIVLTGLKNGEIS